MITITKPEQIEKINLQEKNVYYVYGKIGCGKTHLLKEIIKQYKEQFQKEAIYTDFSAMIQTKEKESQKETGLIVIDDEIKKILKKEFISYTIERTLRTMQEEGNCIIISSSLTPKELEKIENPCAEFLLNSNLIEICYDKESRTKIAEEYSKQCHTTLTKETLKNIIEKEEDLGKIKGKINLMSIDF